MNQVRSGRATMTARMRCGFWPPASGPDKLHQRGFDARDCDFLGDFAQLGFRDRLQGDLLPPAIDIVQQRAGLSAKLGDGEINWSLGGTELKGRVAELGVCSLAPSLR